MSKTKLFGIAATFIIVAGLGWLNVVGSLTSYFFMMDNTASGLILLYVLFLGVPFALGMTVPAVIFFRKYTKAEGKANKKIIFIPLVLGLVIVVGPLLFGLSMMLNDPQLDSPLEEEMDTIRLQVNAAYGVTGELPTKADLKITSNDKIAYSIVDSKNGIYELCGEFRFDTRNHNGEDPINPAEGVLDSTEDLIFINHDKGRQCYTLSTTKTTL